MLRSLISFIAVVVAALAVAVAIPATWATQNVIDEAGFTHFLQPVAASEQTRDAVANQIIETLGTLASQQGLSSRTAELARPVTDRYTNSAQFPHDFADAAGQVQQWLINPPADGRDPSVMRINLSPMVQRVVSSLNLPVKVPASIPVDLSSSRQSDLRAGGLAKWANLGRIASRGGIVVATAAAIVALLVARRRSIALMLLGFGVMIAAAADYLGVRFSMARMIHPQASSSSTTVTQTWQVVSREIETSMGQWILVAAGVGALLVVVGVLSIRRGRAI